MTYGNLRRRAPLAVAFLSEEAQFELFVTEARPEDRHFSWALALQEGVLAPHEQLQYPLAVALWERDPEDWWWNYDYLLTWPFLRDWIDPALHGSDAPWRARLRQDFYTTDGEAFGRACRWLSNHYYHTLTNFDSELAVQEGRSPEVERFYLGLEQCVYALGFDPAMALAKLDVLIDTAQVWDPLHAADACAKAVEWAWLLGPDRTKRYQLKHNELRPERPI